MYIIFFYHSWCSVLHAGTHTHTNKHRHTYHCCFPGCSNTGWRINSGSSYFSSITLLLLCNFLCTSCNTSPDLLFQTHTLGLYSWTNLNGVVLHEREGTSRTDEWEVTQHRGRLIILQHQPSLSDWYFFFYFRYRRGEQQERGGTC